MIKTLHRKKKDFSSQGAARSEKGPAPRQGVLGQESPRRLLAADWGRGLCARLCTPCSLRPSSLPALPGVPRSLLLDAATVSRGTVGSGHLGLSFVFSADSAFRCGRPAPSRFSPHWIRDPETDVSFGSRAGGTHMPLQLLGARPGPVSPPGLLGLSGPGTGTHF